MQRRRSQRRTNLHWRHPTQSAQRSPPRAKQLDRLKAIIERVGFRVPVLIDQHNGLVAGHARLEAAMQLGLPTIPAIRISDLDEAELRALALADNRIAELATWDEEVLRIELGELVALDFDFAISKSQL
jgi:ParB-like chromosome segregation protein Spo0J